MNNKGFTLIEVLVVVVIIAIVGMIVVEYVGSTLSISKNEAYKLMKDNIISASYDYLNECNASIISCDLNWGNDEVSFSLLELKNAGYFSNLKSPIDDKDLGTCIKLVATKDNGNVNVKLIDECY